jgi:hypothetical protein
VHEALRFFCDGVKPWREESDGAGAHS